MKPFILVAGSSNTGMVIKTHRLPVPCETIPGGISYTARRYELCWKYDLPKGKHSVCLKLNGLPPDRGLDGITAIIYSSKPVDGPTSNQKPAN